MRNRCDFCPILLVFILSKNIVTVEPILLIQFFSNSFVLSRKTISSALVCLCMLFVYELQNHTPQAAHGLRKVCLRFSLNWSSDSQGSRTSELTSINVVLTKISIAHVYSTIIKVISAGTQVVFFTARTTMESKYIIVIPSGMC